MSYNADDIYRKPAEKKRMTTFFSGETRLMKILLPAVIIVLAILASTWMMGNRPKAKTRPVTRNAMLVEVTPVSFGTHETEIQAMGVVTPSKMVELKPQVSGEIVAVADAFLPGGNFQAGEKVLGIDPTDYRLAVRQKASDVARTKAELQIEKGNQLIARKEYELLNQSVSPEEEALILRQPQLESSEAAYEAALASLEQAKLDLDRTAITAPFNAVVQTREVNLGTRVNPTTPLATLVGTDRYWVEVSVPVSQLEWIRIPETIGEKGADVRIFDSAAWGDDAYRTGEVIGLAAAVEPQGRMARLLVSVPDPLARSKENQRKPVVLLDTSMQVAIAGKSLTGVAAIDRPYLRDNDTVWIMNASDELEIRPVQIAFRERDRVFVSAGIAPGEMLVTSDLPAPVEGMRLRAESTDPSTGSTASDEPEKNRRAAQP